MGGAGVYGQGIAPQSSQNGDCSNGMMYEVSCHIYNLQKHTVLPCFLWNVHQITNKPIGAYMVCLGDNWVFWLSHVFPVVAWF